MCRRYYVVFTGLGRIEPAAAGAPAPHLRLAAAAGRARDRAFEMHALFVDAREVPFMICQCGQFLNFSAEYCEGAARLVQ